MFNKTSIGIESPNDHLTGRQVNGPGAGLDERARVGVASPRLRCVHGCFVGGNALKEAKWTHLPPPHHFLVHLAR